MFNNMFSSTYYETNINENEIITKEYIVNKFKTNLTCYVYINDKLNEAQNENNQNIKTSSLIFIYNSLLLKFQNMNANENVLFENLQKEIDDIAEEQKHILLTHIKKLFNLKMLEYQKVLIQICRKIN